MDVGPTSEVLNDLAVLVSAMTGAEIVHPPRDEPRPPGPGQFPEDVSWLTTLPEVVAWLRAGDRDEDITAGRSRWRAANLRSWRT